MGRQAYRGVATLVAGILALMLLSAFGSCSSKEKPESPSASGTASPTLSPSLVVPIFEQTGTGSEGTADFTVSSNWLLEWEYKCAAGQKDGFMATVVPSSTVPFNGTFNNAASPNASGANGTGVAPYYQPGTFNFLVSTACHWSVSVPKPIFTQSGQGSATTAQFTAPSLWSLNWQYSCAADQTDGFIVYVIGSSGATIPGPSDSGPTGSGLFPFKSAAQLELDVNSKCSWDLSAYLGKLTLISPAPTP
jgi:hypothetical protein